MQFLSVPAALLLSAAAGVAATGAAFPPHVDVPQSAAPETGLRLVPVGGCHANVRTHYVPEFDRTMAHFHRGNDCRPFPAEKLQEDGRPVDCHRDVRVHRINGVMVRHRHVGKNCAVRVARQMG